MFLQRQLLAYTQEIFLSACKQITMATLRKTNSYLNAPFLPHVSQVRFTYRLQVPRTKHLKTKDCLLCRKGSEITLITAK